MSEPSADDKIEVLVRSVLAAVDARLDEVRVQVHTLVTDVDERHRQVLAKLLDLERRIESLSEPTRAQAPTGPEATVVIEPPARPTVAVPVITVDATLDTPDDEIDIARLTDLLSERLGQLVLPPLSFAGSGTDT